MKTVNSVLDTCKMKVAGAEERGEKTKKLKQKGKGSSSSSSSSGSLIT